MSFLLSISAQALDDYYQLLSYIHNRSPTGAAAWVDAFKNICDRIQINPLLYGLIPERGRLLVNYREAFFKTRKGRRYRIVFAVVDTEITVLYIRGPGQDFIDREQLRLP